MSIRVYVCAPLLIAVIVAAIVMGSPILAFLNAPSAVLVLGITVFGVFWSFPAGDIGRLVGAYFFGGQMDEELGRLGHAVFTRMGDLAISAGMAGTLIGLVQMLQQMDDPTKIGPAMAVALLTLFYGTIMYIGGGSAASDCIARSGVHSESTSRRGAAPIHIMLCTLFGVLLVFMVLLVAMT